VGSAVEDRHTSIASIVYRERIASVHVKREFPDGELGRSSATTACLADYRAVGSENRELPRLSRKDGNVASVEEDGSKHSIKPFWKAHDRLTNLSGASGGDGGSRERIQAPQIRRGDCLTGGRKWPEQDDGAQE
jgi:hypothetical protein